MKYKYVLCAVLIIILCTISFISGACFVDHKCFTRAYVFNTSSNLGEDYDRIKSYYKFIDEWDDQYMDATDSIIYYGTKLIMGEANLENREELLEHYISNTKKYRICTNCTNKNNIIETL